MKTPSQLKQKRIELDSKLADVNAQIQLKEKHAEIVQLKMVGDIERDEIKRLGQLVAQLAREMIELANHRALVRGAIELLDWVQE